MSTRSIVAVATPSGWEGRYVHWDGYPTARGPLLADYVAEHGYAGYVELLNSSPKGMRSFPDREDDFAVERYDDGSSALIVGCDATCSSCDPLFIEWVYVVRPNGRVQVLASRNLHGSDYRHIELYDGPLAGADWAAIEAKR